MTLWIGQIGITIHNGVTYKNLEGKICLSDTIILEDDIETLSFPIRDNQRQ